MIYLVHNKFHLMLFNLLNGKVYISLFSCNQENIIYLDLPTLSQISNNQPLETLSQPWQDSLTNTFVQTTTTVAPKIFHLKGFFITEKKTQKYLFIS